LSHIEETGGKPRLLLDPAMLVEWDRLNPTERYFNLLEAWLRIASAEILGDAHWNREKMLLPCVRAWQSTLEKGQRFDTQYPQYVCVSGIDRDFYNLALLDLFGLMEVEPPPRPVAPCRPPGFSTPSA
jgi:hypothetical protein